MRTQTVALAAVLLLATAAFAQNPNNPQQGNPPKQPPEQAAHAAVVKHMHFYNNKHFWIGEGIIALAVAADYATTAGSHNETNFLLGKSPSNGRLVGVGAAAFGFYTGMSILSQHVMRNDPNKYLRFTSYYDIPAIAGVIHGLSAASNAHLRYECREAHLTGC